MSFFSSRHMPEVRFAITQQQNSVLTGIMDHWLRYWLWDHWPKHPFKHWVNPFLDGRKPALPDWRLGVPIERDAAIQKALIILHSFIHSFIYSDIFTFMMGTYLFKCLAWLTTQCIHGFLDPSGTHTDCISNSAILSDNFMLLLSDF